MFTVYALDQLEEPSPEFCELQSRAAKEYGTSLHYRQIDVRNEAKLHKIVQDISEENGRLDGLIAAAGINEEIPALKYTAAAFNKMMEVNVTGAFLTAQAAARQMVKFEKGGSIVMIASMSGTIANRVRLFYTLAANILNCPNNNCARDSSAPLITHPSQPFFNWAATWLPNGVPTELESIPFPQATSSQLWWRNCSWSFQRGGQTGRLRIC